MTSGRDPLLHGQRVSQLEGCIALEEILARASHLGGRLAECAHVPTTAVRAAGRPRHPDSPDPTNIMGKRI